MATIDRDKLREDVKFWLPDGNTLSDDQIDKLDEMIISKIGDDDAHYDQILCLSIELAAIKNSSNTSISSTDVKKEKLGPLEIESFQNKRVKDPWPDWIRYDLPIICGIIGYTDHLTKLKHFQIYVSPGSDIDIFDGQCDNYLNTCCN